MRVKIMNDQDIKFLAKVWKKGKFRSYDYVGVGSTIDRLIRLGILIKIGYFEYEVDRERYVEISKNFPKDLKQTKLFG